MKIVWDNMQKNRVWKSMKSMKKYEKYEKDNKR